MGDFATSLIDRLGAERESARSEVPTNRGYAVAALVVALLATVAASAVMVFAQPVPVPSAPVRQPAPAPPAADSPPTTPPPASISTFEYTGTTVGEAVVGLEAAGAEVELYDARLWERPVSPDWRVCIASELFLGDTPSGIVQISAVPAGDPCP